MIVREFQEVLYEVFEYNDYTVLLTKTREVRVWFEDRHLTEVKKAWSFHGSSHPLLDNILQKMKEIGWQFDIVNIGTQISSRSKLCSKVTRSSVSKELIMDDEEDIILRQLASGSFWKEY